MAAVAGCPTVKQADPVTPSGEHLQPYSLDIEGVEPSTDTSALAWVLQIGVDNNGYVLLRKWFRSQRRLETQLKLFAATGPTITPELYPTLADRLAYWYNARAAWSMRLGVDQYRGDPDDIDAMQRRPFPLDGRSMTLTHIDHEILALDGPAALMTAPGLDLRRAKIPRQPFVAESVLSDVDTRFAEWIGSPDRFCVSVGKKTVYYPPVLWQYRQNFIDAYHARYGGPADISLTTALLPLVHGGPHYRLQNAIGYTPACDCEPGKLAIIDLLPRDGDVQDQ